MPTPASHTDLLLPADLAAISATRSVLSELLTARGWTEDRVEEAVLAASEAIGNAIEHGSLGEDRVCVTIDLSDAMLELRVSDT
ncbi:MAG: ATP-binding protein, partial [Miltoncostaeaceae bacterium]